VENISEEEKTLAGKIAVSRSEVPLLLICVSVLTLHPHTTNISSIPSIHPASESPLNDRQSDRCGPWSFFLRLPRHKECDNTEAEKERSLRWTGKQDTIATSLL
jgi:hypothetical protein